MKEFLKRSLLFLTPFLVLLAYFTVVDVFMLYHDDPRESPFPDLRFTPLNQNQLSVNMFQKQYADHCYNAFVFGNSRSRAIRASSWQRYLEPPDTPYHFAAGGAGLYDAYKKVLFLDEQGVQIDHVILVVDPDYLTGNENQQEPMLKTPPKVSKEPRWRYYAGFYQMMLQPQFILAYFDYLLLRDYRPYMQGFIVPDDARSRLDFVTGDITYESESLIAADSIDYYRMMIEQGAFFPREADWQDESGLSKEEEEQLRAIKFVFDKHGTHYKIVISPTYDQIRLNEKHRQCLRAIFGEAAIFDFSGKNELTKPLGNYSEGKHYRPHIGDVILTTLYSKK